MRVFVVTAVWKEDGNPYCEVLGVYEDDWYARELTSKRNNEGHPDKSRDIVDYFVDWEEMGVE
ncbi:MAG: hypothetical protein ACRDCE_08710 [Cetobacterium sp.]|uniref:hypothetical protein n=1 Tax=Cetobacterium sp. TaxID=2071632 RepID=UPI003EE76694